MLECGLAFLAIPELYLLELAAYLPFEVQQVEFPGLAKLCYLFDARLLERFIILFI